MPNPTNNKLVDSKTIAALFDMTPRRVQQLTKDGVIAAVKEGNANRYDLLPTIQRYIRYPDTRGHLKAASKPCTHAFPSYVRFLAFSHLWHNITTPKLVKSILHSHL